MRIVWPFERDNLINNRSLAYYRNRREKKERRKKWSINSWPMERTRIILIQVISSVPLATWSFSLFSGANYTRNIVKNVRSEGANHEIIGAEMDIISHWCKNFRVRISILSNWKWYGTQVQNIEEREKNEWAHALNWHVADVCEDLIFFLFGSLTSPDMTVALSTAFYDC